jgi:hypothetical protein
MPFCPCGGNLPDTVEDMEAASRRRSAVARALLALVFVLTLSACGGEKPPLAQPTVVPNAPVDLPVEAIGLPEGVDLEIAQTDAGVENGDNLDFVSPVYSLAPAGPLTEPATVTIELDNALPESATIFVASRDSDAQPWSLQRARLTRDLRSVEFETKKLNQVGVMSLEVGGAVESLITDVRAGIVTGINRKLKATTCGTPGAALETGYSAASSKSETLFWCFGLEGEKRIVRVTNRRLVPVQIVHPQVPVVSDPPSVPFWASWAKALGAQTTFLPPGRTATYDVDLEPEGAVAVTAASGVASQSLRLLQAQVRALVIRIARLGLGRADVTKSVAALLARPQCARTIGKGTDAMLAGCLSPAKLVQTFGPRAQLLVPLVAAPAYAQALRQVAATLAAGQARETQRIVVKRAAPDFSTFFGFWSGTDRMLAVNDKGVATEQRTSEGKLLVKLTYQLDYPDLGPAESSATVTLKSIKIGQRKLIKGRIPRVGATGTLVRRGGLMTSPFLTSVYCNEANAKRKICE